MNTICAEPLKKVDKIEFGMERDVVRKLYGEYEEFKKSEYSENTTDDFGNFHVYYDENNKCEAVEIFDDVEVTVNGEIIFPVKIEEAEKIESSFVRDEEGLISIEKSIGIYAPDEDMESILFGKKGYYEN